MGIYIQYILYSLVLIFFISNVGVIWGGGGGVIFSHFMLFPRFLEKKILGIIKKNLIFEILKSASSLTG